MDDAISREQAIKATWKDTGYTDPFNVMTAIRDRIKQLPTIQPNIGKWIPVTEQPPEVGKSVLICDAYGDICLGHRTHFGYYYPDFCDDKIKDVRAWCELPEPYKGVNT